MSRRGRQNGDATATRDAPVRDHIGLLNASRVPGPGGTRSRWAPSHSRRHPGGPRRGVRGEARSDQGGAAGARKAAELSAAGKPYRPNCAEPPPSLGEAPRAGMSRSIGSRHASAISLTGPLRRATATTHRQAARCQRRSPRRHAETVRARRLSAWRRGPTHRGRHSAPARADHCGPVDGLPRWRVADVAVARRPGRRRGQFRALVLRAGKTKTATTCGSFQWASDWRPCSRCCDDPRCSSFRRRRSCSATRSAGSISSVKTAWRTACERPASWACISTTCGASSRVGCLSRAPSSTTSATSSVTPTSRRRRAICDPRRCVSSAR